MSRITPADAESNGQSHVYMELANVNMCSERFRTFLSDCIRHLAALEDILSPDDAPEITLDELREMCKAKREGREKILPIANRTPLFFIDKELHGKPTIVETSNWIAIISKDGIFIEDGDAWVSYNDNYDYIFGEKVFATRPAAEAVLTKEGEKK